MVRLKIPNSAPNERADLPPFMGVAGRRRWFKRPLGTLTAEERAERGQHPARSLQYNLDPDKAPPMTQMHPASITVIDWVLLMIHTNANINSSINPS